MLININQKDKRLLRVIRDYGCLFLCFAYISPLKFEGEEGCNQLNSIFLDAINSNIISGDLNKDGDYDDAGEAEVLDHNRLARLFNLDVVYDGVHHDAIREIPENVQYVFGMYFWKGSHFVVLDKNKNVVFDPLVDSNTVKYGALKTTRWYY